MKKNLVKNLQCIVCKGSKLTLHISKSCSREIREGFLKCEFCGEVFKNKKGIVHLLPKLHPLVAAEQKGWIKRAKTKGWYNVSDEYLLSLPRPEKSNEVVDWYRQADDFEYMVDIAFPKWKNKYVLDVGAGKPWTSRYLARKGAHVVATDILEDFRIGLGVADVYIRNDGIFLREILQT